MSESTLDPVTEPAEDLAAKVDGLSDKITDIAARLDLVESHSHEPQPPVDETPVKKPWTHRRFIPRRDR
jgi:hypothetical protein